MKKLKKNVAVAVCIVCLITISFFSGLLIGNLEYDNTDIPEDDQPITHPLDNGRPYRKAPIIIPVDNGRPY